MTFVQTYIHTSFHTRTHTHTHTHARTHTGILRDNPGGPIQFIIPGTSRSIELQDMAPSSQDYMKFETGAGEGGGSGSTSGASAQDRDATSGPDPSESSHNDPSERV
jgi:hypothetical protein